ncbi:Flp family type IVb pilin [Nocardioides aurantiacus]|uniref:Pilus assembly protein Flp/PilA n=1 Tax=Nocardioides aurantiacus TaxID=86796 RepID=A0A3N2CSV0_9ACTN|nr:Flp family type IVb pilin [Nocardioides aurantiacus]ROR90448.1 pilus assembly protein Flp/PilA [Nocardioides aurantiacus]
MIKLYVALQMLQTRRDEEGASAVEYGLLVAAIAAIVVAIVFLLGDVVTEVFQDTCDSVQAEAATTAQC